MSHPALLWDEEVLFTQGDAYFAGLLRAIDQANHTIELETYIFEKGVLADRFAEKLKAAAARGVRVRLIVDGWGSPGFVHDYLKSLKGAGIKVRFFRVIPFLLKRLPGDPRNFWRRLVLRFRRVNRGNHRKFCLIDQNELWVGSFNVSDVHLMEIQGERAWKDVGVKVRGRELRYARRAFQRAYRGWRAINFPSRSPKLLLLNDSFIHKRRTRRAHIRQIKKARERIWIATPYFVPIGRIMRLLIRRAKQGIDVRVIVPKENDVWFMKWMSLPLLRLLSRKGVKVFIYSPRFSHQKVFVADNWITVGSTNLNHRSFLHDLEMDVVITNEENKRRIVEGYVQDQSQSQAFDARLWSSLPRWKRVLSSIFLLAKYWA